MASSKSSEFGSGGMTTKIWAAKICMNSGCSTIITNGSKNNSLKNIDSTNSTFFHTESSPENSRKKWLLNHLHPSGIIIVDDGAEKAILQNKSLLPSGVLDIKGNFSRGDILSILNEKNIKIGIGVIAYDHSEAKKNYWKKK